MRKSNSPIIIFIAFLLLNSCQLSDNSTAIENKDEISLGELLRSSIAQAAYNHSAIGSRIAGGLVQYLAYQDVKQITYEQYRFTSSTFDNLWSDGYYAGSLTNLKELQNLAKAKEDQMMEAISMILLALEFSDLTLMFGDIPYTEALLGDQNTTPVYTPQQSIISDLIIMLDEAMIKLSNADNSDSSAADNDHIYGYDKELWRKFANGLKARLLLNQSNKSNTDLNQILSLLDESFKSKNEEASFSFTEDFANPLNLFIFQRPGTLLAGTYFAERLHLPLDPRAEYITKQVNNNWVVYDIGSLEPVPCQRTARLPFLSYTEILFMKTEVAFHLDGYTLEVQELLKSAMLASFNDHQIEITSDMEDFIDNRVQQAGSPLINTLEKIMEQAYLAYYGFSHVQAWSNYRRLNYPVLSSTATIDNESNPSNSIPERFMYPSTEYLYNAENVNEAINNQEGALLDSRMWIFKE